MAIDGRSPDFPNDWHPADDREILIALISEIRNALVPARYNLSKSYMVGPMESVQRVLDFADVCSDKIKI